MCTCHYYNIELDFPDYNTKFIVTERILNEQELNKLLKKWFLTRKQKARRDELFVELL